MPLEADLDVSTGADRVSFTFVVTNRGSEPVELTFPSGQVADVVVSADGDTVWRWSGDRMFTQALRTRTLAPGESVSDTMTWDAPPSGEYIAEASLSTTGTDVTATAALQV
jgi:hypothetical protein